MSIWTHVKDRKPEPYTLVLFYTEGGAVAVGYMTNEEEWTDGHRILDGINTVVWWRELPPLPEHM